MTATEIMAIEAEQGGYKLKDKWNGGWNNFTEADVVADCKDSRDPEGCMKQMRASTSYEGGSKSRPWLENAPRLLSDIFGTIANRNEYGNQGGGYTPYVPPQRQGMSTGAKVAIGIGIVAVIGAIAYFATKKK
jgi:hypothetical protein